MSARSELVFRASGRISNPLLLCALVSARVRQLMRIGSGSRSTAEIVNYALGELSGGLLQFQVPGEKDGKGPSKSPSNYLMAAARAILWVEANDRPD